VDVAWESESTADDVALILFPEQPARSHVKSKDKNHKRCTDDFFFRVSIILFYQREIDSFLLDQELPGVRFSINNPISLVPKFPSLW
jgi:hypothetical protein